jgi:hypothetical protein
MNIFGQGESIECESANVIAKKIEVSPPLNYATFGKCLKYICTRDGEASIIKELFPKSTKLSFPVTNLNLGDTIKANRFYVLVQGFKAKKLEKVRFSGAHNARQFNSDSYTFAEISKPYPVGQYISFNPPKGFISPISQLSK